MWPRHRRFILPYAAAITLLILGAWSLYAQQESAALPSLASGIVINRTAAVERFREKKDTTGEPAPVYDNERYIDRLRRSRAASPAQMSKWKRRKEERLRERTNTTRQSARCGPPPFSDQPFYLTICAVFKNEGSYLEEWLDYHLCAGVQHFYLFDHRSVDNGREILEPYVRAGLAHVESADVGKNPQMSLYTRCIREHRNESKWMAFIDTDEFICPMAQPCVTTLLEEYERFPGLLISWVFFGSNHHVFQSAERLITSHPRHGTQVSRRYKTIAQPAHLLRASPLTPHGMVYHEGEMPVNERKVAMLPRESSVRGRASAEIVRLNHYRTKSMQEWVHKADRCHTGKSSEAQCLQRLRHWSEFDQNHVRDTDRARRLLPCMQALYVPMRTRKPPK